MIRIAGYTALVLATLGILILLWQFSEAVVMFLLSLAVAAAFRPLAEALRQGGIRGSIAPVLSYGIVLAVLIILLVMASSPLTTDLQQATNDGLIAYEGIRMRWMNATNNLFSDLADRLPPTQALYDALTGEGSSQTLQAVFGAAEGTLEFLTRLGIVLILSIYWSVDHVRFERLWLSLLPVERRAQARNVWLAVESGVGAAIRREVTLSVLAGLFLYLGYFVLGVEYAMLLAFLGAIARLIPWLGLVLVVLFSFLFGYGQSWSLGLAAAVYTLLVLLLLETIIGARIFPRRRYSSLQSVIVVIALVDSFGLLGAVLAPILAVALQILFKNLLPVYSSSVNDLSMNTLINLRSKLGEIRQMAGSLEDQEAVEPANLVSRLERLLEKTQQFYSAD
jgi:putative permease